MSNAEAASVEQSTSAPPSPGKVSGGTAMSAASMIALSGGWLLTAVFYACDLGAADPLFWPVLALSLPAPVGLVSGVLRYRKSPDPVKLPRFIAFAVLGGAILTGAVLLLMVGLDITQPPEEQDASEYSAPP